MWDSLRIEDFHIQQHRITKDSASVTAEVELQASRDAKATLTFSYHDAAGKATNAGTQTVELRAGINQIACPDSDRQARPLVAVGVWRQDRYHSPRRSQSGGIVAARAELKTGLRAIELRRDADQWGKASPSL